MIPLQWAHVDSAGARCFAGHPCPSDRRCSYREPTFEAQGKISPPPGISVFLGGKPIEAAEQVCEAFPNANRLLAAARTVASATAEAIRQAGFDVIVVPTRHFANHGRLTHPVGEAGFDDKNLNVLAQVFRETVAG